MTDLKELFDESVREAEERIQRTRRNTRSEPEKTQYCPICVARERESRELPEGYWEDEDGSLIDPNGDITAWMRKDGMLAVAAEPWDFPALAIWLQRRSK